MSRNDQAALTVLREYFDLQAQRNKLGSAPGPERKEADRLSDALIAKWRLLGQWGSGNDIVMAKLAGDV